MASAEAARTAVGIVGNIVTLFFYVSPVPTFVRLWKQRSVEQYSAFPYPAALMNCLAWTLYGLPMVQPGSILVLTISASGVVVESVYVALFLVFSDKRKRLRVFLMLLVGLFFIALFSSLVLTLVHTHKVRSMIVGIICVCFSTLLYSSPLVVMILNGLGLLLGLTQLIPHAVYYKSPNELMAAGKGKEVDLSDVCCCCG